MTGLPTRRAMDSELRHTEAVAVQRQECYSVALMDIDYFKGTTITTDTKVATASCKSVARS